MNTLLPEAVIRKFRIVQRKLIVKKRGNRNEPPR
jgi:hypothetical protein